MRPPPTWAYCVTSVKDRLTTYLPGTLASLAAAGFVRPWLCVDDCQHPSECSALDSLVSGLTVRWPRIDVHGNWWLSAHELLIRNPACEFYAVFQDDFVIYRNLRGYLERSCDRRAEDRYWNLYTFPPDAGRNSQLAPPSEGYVGWYDSNQLGKGAVALVFTRPVLLKLLAAPHMVERPLHIGRGKRFVDGGIVTALAKEGVREVVHHPSLVQHTGDVSQARRDGDQGPHSLAPSFRGADFDALSLGGSRSDAGK